MDVIRGMEDCVVMGGDIAVDEADLVETLGDSTLMLCSL